jgi:choline dehydrogenase
MNGQGWRFSIATALMTPRSVGSVRLSDRDPEAPPLIDHAYLTDPDDYDLDALLDGIALARELAAQPPLADLVGAETEPGPALRDREALRRQVRAACVHDYHPVGTCKMGPAADPEAVVDARGKVHGLNGLFVADAAIMPVVPRANTNVPAFVVGERIAASLLGR